MSYKICVIGGGNLGMILSAKFSQKNEVTLFTKSKEYFGNEILVFNDSNNLSYKSVNLKISDNLKESINGCDFIFITYPSILFQQLAKELIPLLSPGQHLVSIPGSGGFELFFKEALSKGCTISGLQRVHAVARVIEKGKSVKEMGIRKSLKVASIPNKYNSIIKNVLEELFSIPVEAMDNYLNNTLINSNPILHTSRLYNIFKDYTNGKTYDSLPLFYEDWNNETSELLIQMDKELFDIINVLKSKNINVNCILPILEHYESTDSISLTKKIKSISSFAGLKTPFILKDEKLIPDFSSRYFTADFPLGLDIIISFSELMSINCPNLIKVSNWYHTVTNTKREFSFEKFRIYNIDELINFYSN